MKTFSEDEIEKAKELQKKKIFSRIVARPDRGSFIHARQCPNGCQSINENVFLVVEPSEGQHQEVWLPTIDECLEICRELKISFAQITDYIHRRRFAEGRERLGIYQLILENIR